MAVRRRTFLKAAAGAGVGLAVGLAASPAPWRTVGDLTRLNQDPPWLPQPATGPLERVFTTSLACPSGMGITVLMNQGRPVLVRGNPDHPLSQGAATTAAQSEVDDLYRPDRILSPLLKNEQGRFEPVSWATALDLLAARLTEAGPRVMAVGDGRLGTLRFLLGSFLERLGSADQYFMPSEAALARAAVRFMGGAGQPGFDLDNAPGLVALGADLFESMPASPHFRKCFAPRREAPSVSFSSQRGASAALCQDWRPLAAGGEAALAMGIAGELAMLGAAKGQAHDLADFVALARQRFGPDRVEAMTGVSPQMLREAALHIAAGALPVPGSPCARGLGVAPFAAGLALSVMAGRVNKPGGVWLTRNVVEGHPKEGADLLTRLKDTAVGLAEAPAVLLLVECDPAGELPEMALARRGLAKAGFKAALARTMTASAGLCDMVLPAPMPLERWDDAATPYGLAFASYGLARPLAKGRADARHPGDVLLELAARLGRPLGASSFKQALRRTVLGLEERGGYVAREVLPWKVLAGQAQPAPEAGLWDALEAGGLWADPSPAPAELSCGARFLAQALAPPGIELSSPLVLALTDDPSPADAPEGPVLARLNAATAAKVRVKPGGRVRLSGASGFVEAVVSVDESVMDGHVALPIGPETGNGLAAASALPEPVSGTQAYAGCRVQAERL